MWLFLCYLPLHGRCTHSLTLLGAMSCLCDQHSLARTKSFSQAVLSCELFVTGQLVDFKDFRSGEIFEGSSEAFLCQMSTRFKDLKYASVSPGCFAPRDGKEGRRGG